MDYAISVYLDELARQREQAAEDCSGSEAEDEQKLALGELAQRIAGAAVRRAILKRACRTDFRKNFAGMAADYNACSRETLRQSISTVRNVRPAEILRLHA